VIATDLLAALSAVGLPTTREGAIAAIVESDVARWGEAEREASRRAHSRRSLSLALNELANRADLDGWEAAPIRGTALAGALRKASVALRSASDDRALRSDDRALRSGG
jgi:hypothetical protein